MEPISAGIIAGGSIIAGLLQSYFGGKAADEETAAAREAQQLNYSLATKEMSEEQRRFNIQNSLENMKFRLWKEEKDMDNQERAEKQQYDRAFDFSNRLLQLGSAGQQRGQALAGSWAQQARL